MRIPIDKEFRMAHAVVSDVVKCTPARKNAMRGMARGFRACVQEGLFNQCNDIYAPLTVVFHNPTNREAFEHDILVYNVDTRRPVVHNITVPTDGTPECANIEQDDDGLWMLLNPTTEYPKTPTELIFEVWPPKYEPERDEYATIRSMTAAKSGIVLDDASPTGPRHFSDIREACIYILQMRSNGAPRPVDSDQPRKLQTSTTLARRHTDGTELERCTLSAEVLRKYGCNRSNFEMEDIDDSQPVYPFMKQIRTLRECIANLLSAAKTRREAETAREEAARSEAGPSGATSTRQRIAKRRTSGRPRKRRAASTVCIGRITANTTFMTAEANRAVNAETVRRLELLMLAMGHILVELNKSMESTRAALEESVSLGDLADFTVPIDALQVLQSGDIC